MFHGLLEIVLGPSKLGGSNVKLGPLQTMKLPLSPRNIILPWWGPRLCVNLDCHKYVVAPQHGPLSLYTKFEDPSVARINFYLV